MNKNKMTAAAVIASVAAAVHLIAAIVCISRLPDVIPLHFNANWVCDGAGSRWILLIFAAFPLTTAVNSSLIPSSLSFARVIAQKGCMLSTPLYNHSSSQEDHSPYLDPYCL